MTAARKELKHDRQTVSLLTDHMVFSPKYRGKILEGEIVLVAEAIDEKNSIFYPWMRGSFLIPC